MKKKATVAIVTLISIFLILLIVVLAYDNMQDNHEGTSYQYGSLIVVHGVAVIISPNGTNIPLNVPIQVETWRPTYVGNLILKPDVPILYREEKTVGVASLQVTFHLSKLLQPNTNYTVTIPIMNETITWNFTTTK